MFVTPTYSDPNPRYMTVKKLIEWLSKLPEDLPVLYADEANDTINSMAYVKVRKVTEEEADNSTDGEAWTGKEVCIVSGNL